MLVCPRYQTVYVPPTPQPRKCVPVVGGQVCCSYGTASPQPDTAINTTAIIGRPSPFPFVPSPSPAPVPSSAPSSPSPALPTASSSDDQIVTQGPLGLVAGALTRLAAPAIGGAAASALGLPPQVGTQVGTVASNFISPIFNLFPL